MARKREGEKERQRKRERESKKERKPGREKEREGEKEICSSSSKKFFDPVKKSVYHLFLLVLMKRHTFRHRIPSKINEHESKRC